MIDPGTLTAVKAFSAVANSAAEWLAEIKEKYKAGKEIRAASVLHHAGMVVAACRALDDAFRSLADDIGKMDSAWTAERRLELMNRVLELARQEILLDALNHNLGALGNDIKQNLWQGLIKKDERSHAIIKQISSLGNETYDLLAKTEHTPYKSSEQLTDLLRGIQCANTEDWIGRTKELASESLLILERSALRVGVNAFGALSGDLEQKYSLPPYPTYHRAA